MPDKVTVVFRNQCRNPVRVVLNGYDEGGQPHLVSTGVVSGLSGVFTVSGFGSYACSATADLMTTPLLANGATVTVVFEVEPGVQR